MSAGPRPPILRHRPGGERACRRPSTRSGSASRARPPAWPGASPLWPRPWPT
ncbi:hypothetical protein HMPREF0731_0258, partial [Pseudoroseomonas cervicalis ATCC 49957]